MNQMPPISCVDIYSADVVTTPKIPFLWRFSSPVTAHPLTDAIMRSALIEHTKYQRILPHGKEPSLVLQFRHCVRPHILKIVKANP